MSEWQIFALLTLNSTATKPDSLAIWFRGRIAPIRLIFRWLENSVSSVTAILWVRTIWYRLQKRA
jgi:hypothetical protein